MESAKLNSNLTHSEGGANIESGSSTAAAEATLDKDEDISCFRLFYEWRQCTCKSLNAKDMLCW